MAGDSGLLSGINVTRVAGEDAGSYAVTASGFTSGNYAVNYDSGRSAHRNGPASAGPADRVGKSSGAQVCVHAITCRAEVDWLGQIERPGDIPGLSAKLYMSGHNGENGGVNAF